MRPIVVRPLKSPIWLKLGKKRSLLVKNTTPYMKKSNKLVSICIILAHKVIFWSLMRELTINERFCITGV